MRVSKNASLCNLAVIAAFVVISMLASNALARAEASAIAKVEYKTRLVDARGKPVKTRRTVYLSLWLGGTNKLDSGARIYSEKAVITPVRDGIAYYWLGGGKVLGGSLDPAGLRTQEPLYLQEAVGTETNRNSIRSLVQPMDNVWVAINPHLIRYWRSSSLQYSGLLKTTKMPATARREVATLYPDRKIQKEDGSILDVSKSKSSGLQELFDYCFSNRVDGYIMGGASPVGGPISYVSSVPIHLHPSQGFRLDTGAVTLLFDESIGSQPALTIDSCMMVDLRIRGQIVNRSTGYAVAFKPENTLPLDTFVGPTIVDSCFYILTVATRGQGILMEGSINFNTFISNEINGGDYGVHVRSGSFTNNKFTCKHVHNQNKAAMFIEAGAKNTWEVNTNADARDPVGIDTAATDDIWTVNVNSGKKPSIILEPSARGNQFHIMGLSGGFENRATTPTNRFYASPQPNAALSKQGFSAETPGVPQSGMTVVNRNPYNVVVMIIAAGSVSRWSVADVSGTIQLVDGPLFVGQNILLAPGEGIRLDYAPENAPKWRWRALN